MLFLHAFVKSRLDPSKDVSVRLGLKLLFLNIHVDINGLVVSRQSSQLFAEIGPVLKSVAVLGGLEITPRAQSDSDLVGADRIGDGFHNFQGESASLLYGAAIIVGPVVDVVIKELIQKVAIGACEL